MMALSRRPTPVRAAVDRSSTSARVLAALAAVLLAATAQADPPDPMAAPPAGPPAKGPTQPTQGAVTATAPEPSTGPSPPPPLDPRRATAHAAMIVVKVARPAAARSDIVAATLALGGYPMLVTDARVELKVPPTQLDKLLDTIAAAGVVLDKARTRNDRTEEIERLEGRLAGRRKLLRRLRSFLHEADVYATVRIEQQMLQLVVETEQLAGELRVARDAVRYARVSVSFTWRQSAPMRYTRSPFPWLERVSLDDLLRDFGQ